MPENFWFFVVAIGPLLLGAAVAYALLRHRSLTTREKQLQHEATQDLYHERK